MISNNLIGLQEQLVSRVIGRVFVAIAELGEKMAQVPSLQEDLNAWAMLGIGLVKKWFKQYCIWLEKQVKPIHISLLEYTQYLFIRQLKNS